VAGEPAEFFSPSMATDGSTLLLMPETVRTRPLRSNPPTVKLFVPNVAGRLSSPKWRVVAVGRASSTNDLTVPPVASAT